MRILALDVGQRRIGLAISDPLGITAQGLPTLERRNLRADMAALGAVARDHGVTLVVLGYPLHMSGRESAQAEKVKEFAAAIERYLGLPAKLWDERLTTVEASRVLRESGIGQQKRARAVDRLSAVLILQSYLDSQP
jgi:putative Holliday junction resolvase